MKTLFEWVANQDDTTVEWAEKFLHELLTSPTHSGDCTGENHPCNLCVLESILDDYFEYCKHENYIVANPVSWLLGDKKTRKGNRLNDNY